MRRNILFWVVPAAILAVSQVSHFSQPAAAGAVVHSDRQSIAASSMVDPFITWIADQTDLKAPEPPLIVLLPYEQMTKMYFGDMQTSGSFQLRGFYDSRTTTIYLPNTWDPNDLRDQSILLHELVHHVQRSNHVRAPCPTALEQQALDLQAAWLSDQGVSEPYEFIGTDLFTVQILFACQDG